MITRNDDDPQKRSPSTPALGRHPSKTLWRPTINGKVIPGAARTRRDAVMAAKLYQEAEDEKTARLTTYENRNREDK
jgi:hypothetical protein